MQPQYDFARIIFVSKHKRRFHTFSRPKMGQNFNIFSFFLKKTMPQRSYPKKNKRKIFFDDLFSEIIFFCCFLAFCHFSVILTQEKVPCVSKFWNLPKNYIFKHMSKWRLFWKFCTFEKEKKNVNFFSKHC